jgi:hypothetical protein
LVELLLLLSITVDVVAHAFAHAHVVVADVVVAVATDAAATDAATTDDVAVLTPPLALAAAASHVVATAYALTDVAWAVDSFLSYYVADGDVNDDVLLLSLHLPLLQLNTEVLSFG